jgi:glutaredoxin
LLLRKSQCQNVGSRLNTSKRSTIKVMLKFTRFAAAISVVLLALTTSCSRSVPSQQPSSGSNTQGLSAASGQPSAAAVAAKVALASHLKQVDAKFYGTYWCPYCNKQKELFGEQAMSQINYIECDPQGKNPQLDLCQKSQVEGFPTWEINGRQYPGVQSLDRLADVSNYQGDRNFGN